ncbi:MAG TPA: PAS domain S-box protein, partial [Gammaproteobacteria bacterium]|nr:PAS domain S-box protein [Gammaproteobacteria bacterium]
MFLGRFPERLAGLYVLFGTAWIFLSDWLLALALDVPYHFTWGQHVKGSVFIAVTAVLLYGLARRYQARMERTQSELQDEQSFIESVLETAGALVLVTEPDGTVIQCNHACERICGCSRQEILGSKVWEIVEGVDERGQMERVFEELGNRPATRLHVETGWVGADNRRRRIAWTNTALRASDGRLRYGILTGVDVSELRETMNALRDSEALYHGLVESANDAILTADAATGRILVANRQAEELLGRSAGELVGMHQSDLHPPEQDRRYRQIFNDYVGHRVITGPLEVVRPDGTRVPVEISSGTAELSGRRIVHGVFRDISQRMRDEEKLRKLSKVVEYSPGAVMITDAEGRIEYCNPRFHQATGYREDEVLGHTPSFLWADEELDGQETAMWRKLAEGQPWYGEFPIRKENGERTWWFSAVGPVPDDAGNVTHYVTISEDVGQLKFAERAIERLANYDPITGLPNRTLFRDRLEQALLSAEQQRHELAVMILDIDRFKRVNDTLGSEHGDILL